VNWAPDGEFGAVPYAPTVPREGFQHELDEVEALLQDEARLCQDSLRAVIQALVGRDLEAALAVIAGDHDVDRIYQRVDSEIETLLARQAPVASDLRRSLAMIRINMHLERIGDQCVNVAKLTRLIGDHPLPSDLLDDFVGMGAAAGQMIGEAMASFGARDVARAEALVEADQVINRANHGVARRILELAEDTTAHEAGLHAILIARCLERIGDNTVDIGEQTAYLVTGEFREFTDASHEGNL
jgi:phosphate transport system protein